MINVCAVQLWSSKTHSPNDNRNHAIEVLEKAARTGGNDLIVLPEAVSMLCYPDDRPDFTYYDVAEDIPGPTSDAACSIARSFDTNVVIGLIERRTNGCQNVTVVIERSGRIVGTYDKMHEPAICMDEQAALEGNRAGIFDLDFGRIGVFVCWDLFYPEVTEELASRGCELLVFPHLMSFANERSQASLLRQRARETGLAIVAAGMRDAHNHNGSQDGIWPTVILNADGEILIQTDRAGSDLARGKVTL